MADAKEISANAARVTAVSKLVVSLEEKDIQLRQRLFLLDNIVWLSYQLPLARLLFNTAQRLTAEQDVALYLFVRSREIQRGLRKLSISISEKSGFQI